MKRVYVGALAIAGHGRDIQNDLVNGLASRLLQIVVVQMKGHGVTNKVLGSRLESKLLVNFDHGVLVKVKACRTQFMQ